MANIKIIYDRKNIAKRRHCFWKKALEDGNEHTVQYISISDILNQYHEDNASDDNEEEFVPNSIAHENYLPDVIFNNETDIIIINWDAINTDPVYGSDRTFSFIKHYRSTLNKWVEQGGILILESQSTQWFPVEESYRIFDEKIVMTKLRKQIGISATLNKKLSNHPIINGLTDITLADHGLWDEYWFPQTTHIPYAQAFDNPKERRKLYMGWFESYSGDWEPLIYAAAPHDDKPILLCKTVRKNDSENSFAGAYVISTMYIGATDIKPLIKNLLSLSKSISLHAYSQCREYNKAEEEKRMEKEKTEEAIRKKNHKHELIILGAIFCVITVTAIASLILYFDFISSIILSAVTLACSSVIGKYISGGNTKLTDRLNKTLKKNK